MVDQETDKQIGLQLLNRCPANALPQLIHEIIDEICSGKKIQLNKYENHWNSDEWISMTNDVKNFIILNARDNNSEIPIDADDIKRTIEKCIKLRNEELRKYLINETCAVSDTYLKDFDWTAKYVLASDSMASLKTPLLTLDLELKRLKDLKTVSIEMTKEELLKLINTLEVAQKNMLELKI